jgi:hypothetical protein
MKQSGRIVTELPQTRECNMQLPAASVAFIVATSGAMAVQIQAISG